MHRDESPLGSLWGLLYCAGCIQFGLCNRNLNFQFLHISFNFPCINVIQLKLLSKWNCSQYDIYGFQALGHVTIKMVCVWSSDDIFTVFTLMAGVHGVACQRFPLWEDRHWTRSTKEPQGETRWYSSCWTCHWICVTSRGNWSHSKVICDILF